MESKDVRGEGRERRERAKGRDGRQQYAAGLRAAAGKEPGKGRS